MPRHSRNNTNGSNFTYAERQMIGGGTKKERLGRDAMRNFNSCSLCLERAREPRACEDGHVFCQECVLSTLLSQKTSIKRQQALLAQLEEKEQQQQLEARRNARERVLKEFEKSQNGLGVVGRGVGEKRGREDEKDGEAAKKGRFEWDEKEVERIVKDGEEEALRKIKKEQEEERKAKLPNFWLPSLTPNAEKEHSKEIKLQTLCLVDEPAHPLSLKSLTTINFTEEDSTTLPVGERTCICPVCRKALSNNVKSFLLRSCGHVLCHTCTTTLAIPDSSCSHCGEAFPVKKSKKDKDGNGKEKKEKDKSGVIELKREGTGFAAGGKAEGKRFDLAFQG
ncbi:hypothetical protein T439DRAFT_325087 [Meredithblackwellia eburnea MCA 4105]